MINKGVATLARTVKLHCQICHYAVSCLDIKIDLFGHFLEISMVFKIIRVDTLLGHLVSNFHFLKTYS
jgi:hypothetical protein